jgi:hypothetical protein
LGAPTWLKAGSKTAASDTSASMYMPLRFHQQLDGTRSDKRYFMIADVSSPAK